MIYDEELMVKDVRDYLQASLNTEIGLLNAEKNDDLVLETIDSTKYVFEALGEDMKNWTGFFVMYGIVDTPLKEASTGNVIEDITISIEIGTFDKGDLERSNIFFKLLRYRRVLRSLIIKNPDVFRGYAKAKMASLKPNALPLDERNIILKVGIDLRASVTAY